MHDAADSKHSTVDSHSRLLNYKSIICATALPVEKDDSDNEKSGLMIEKASLFKLRLRVILPAENKLFID